MLKWTHYSKAIIRAFSGEDYHDMDIGLSQAILQHYGWRSFFIDLSKDAYIACWFAANKYEDEITSYMCEDFEESPVMLFHRKASYNEFKEDGNIYIIDTRYFSKNNIKIHDLTVLSDPQDNNRFQVQSACLVEAFNGFLPVDSIAAHLIVKHEVLKEYYVSKGVNNTLDIFPDRKNDFILNSLLSLPWYNVPSGSNYSIPFFKRSLEIPEYDFSFIKHLPASITLFKPFWVSDHKQLDNFPFVDFLSFKVSENDYFTGKSDQFDLIEVNQVLLENPKIIIEIDGLIKIPEFSDNCEFEKGIVVEKINNNIYSVSALIVKQLGQVVTGVGTNNGWFYKVINGNWKKINHSKQCPCNNDLRHELQFSLLRMLNEHLKDELMIPEKNMNFSYKGLLNYRGLLK